jgi:voltage-gated potassium channel
MDIGLEDLKAHVIICGFGHLGQTLAAQLRESGYAFVVISNEATSQELATSLGYPLCKGDATNETVLEAAGISQAQSLATVLPDDASNLFITLTAKGLNPNLVVLARGDFAETESKLKLAGADHVVMPATISAQRLVNLITRPHTLDFLEQQTEQVHVIELLSQLQMQIDELVITAASPLVGMSLAALETKAKGAFLVIALRHADGQRLPKPDGATLLNKGDTAIVVGQADAIALFKKQYATKQQLRYRGKQV